jgi:hypothetical protein
VLTKDIRFNERAEYFVHFSAKEKIIFVCTKVKSCGLADISHSSDMG